MFNVKEIEGKKLEKVIGGEDGLEQFSIICHQCGAELYSMEEYSEHVKKCSSGNCYTKPSCWK